MPLSTLHDLALDHYSDRQKLVTATSTVAGQMWSEVDPKRIVESWAQQVPELTAVVSGAQLGAARPAASYTDEMLAEEEVAPAAAADPDPAGFSGHAADGRGLVSLLTNPVFVTLASIQDGFDILNAMSHGRHNLDMIVATEVADAGRLADQVSITSRLGARGFTRLAVGNSCARCLLLAGREYRWSAGFQRHPKCDCIHIPTGIARRGLGPLDQDPRQIYDRMTARERTRAGFTKADQRAIADGADINQVVNAKRGMYTVGQGPSKRKLTNESTTRRGVVKRKQRLSVDECYRVAAGDRDEALALLRDNGYLFDGGPKVVQSAIPLPVAAEVDPALKLSVAELKAIAKQAGVTTVRAGMTKPQLVWHLRNWESTRSVKLAGLPEWKPPRPTLLGGPTIKIEPIGVPDPARKELTGAALNDWADYFKYDQQYGRHEFVDAAGNTAPGGVRVRDLRAVITSTGDYVVKHGTAWQFDGVAYLVEHGPDEFGSQRVAQALAEMRAAHAAVPAAARANRSYAYFLGENPGDAYWRVKFKNPDHTASMSAGNSHVSMWNRRKWPGVSQAEVRHETGHNLDTLVGRKTHGSQSPAWSSAAETDAKSAARVEEFDGRGRITPEVDPARDWPTGVTDYGKSSAAEDYAESVMMYQLGPIARGRIPGETAVRDLYFRDIFPARARMLDREFPELAAEQEAAIKALRSGKAAPVAVAAPTPAAPMATTTLAQARAEFTRLSRESAKGGQALKAVPLRKTQPGDTHIFEGFDAFSEAERKRIQAALVQYERSGFRHLNDWLRSGKVNTTGPFPLSEAELKAMLADMRRAFEASKLSQSVTVYRGLGTGRGVFGDPATWPDDLAGREFTEAGMFSTSASKAVAEEFGGVQLRIVVPEGNPALVLSGIGREAEAEILLPPGMRFRVVKDRGVVGGKRTLDVEVVPAEGAARTATSTATKAARPAVEVTPEQQVRNLLAGKGTAPAIPKTGPASTGYATATVDELREIAEKRIGHLGPVSKRATREQLLAAVRADVDVTDVNVFKRETARLQQLRVDRANQVADLLAEADELIYKGVTPQVMERVLGQAARTAGPLAEAQLAAVVKAMKLGDPVKIRAALDRIATKARVRLELRAGDITTAREGMELVTGGGLPVDLEGRIAGLSTQPAVREVQIENRIRAAYRRLQGRPAEPGRWGVTAPGTRYVGFADLRAELPEIAREELDATLRRMARSGNGVQVVPEEHLRALDAANREAALTGLGPKPKHAIQIDDAAPRSLPVDTAGVEVRVIRPGTVLQGPDGTVVLKRPVVRVVDAEEKARIRQEAIDAVRESADVLREASELIANGAGASVIRERIAIRIARIKSADPAVKAFQRAIATADVEKIRKAIPAAAKKLGLKQVDEAGELSLFNPARHQAITGTSIRQGADIRIVRPGYAFDYQGQPVTLFKPVVEELTPADLLKMRQTAVDTGKGLVELADELAAGGGPAQRRIAIEASALPDDVKATLLAASKVSPAKLKSTLTAQMKKSGVTVGKTPKAPVKFDPKLHEVKGGAKLPVGTKVRVVEPEVTVVHRGETVVVRKAVVEPSMPTFRSSTAPDIKTLFSGPDPEPAIARAINGTYKGGLKAKVTDVSRSSRRIEIEGQLYGPGGRVVGQFERKFIKRPDGTWEAHHELLTIEEKYQGAGFAADFNANLYDWYRRSGFDVVTLDANIDVGVYAWATQGYDFASDAARIEWLDQYGLMRRDVLSGIDSRSPIAGLVSGMTSQEFESIFPGWTQAEYLAQRHLIDDVIARIQTGEKVSVYEISQLGRTPGQGRDDWWVGKAVLFDTVWHGAMPL